MKNKFAKIILLTLISISFLSETWATPLEFQVLPHSNYEMPRFSSNAKSVLTIQSNAQYRRLFGSNPKTNIDWRNNFLILASAGFKSSAGYELNIVGVELIEAKPFAKKRSKVKTTNRIDLSLSEVAPASHCITASVITYPWALVQVKKSRSLKLNKNSKKSANIKSYRTIDRFNCNEPQNPDEPKDIYLYSDVTSR